MGAREGSRQVSSPYPRSHAVGPTNDYPIAQKKKPRQISRCVFVRRNARTRRSKSRNEEDDFFSLAGEGDFVQIHRTNHAKRIPCRLGQPSYT